MSLERPSQTNSEVNKEIVRKQVVGAIDRMRELKDSVVSRGEKLEQEGITTNPETLLSDMINDQLLFLESEEAGDLKASEYCTEHLVLSSLFALQARKALEIRNNPDSTPYSIRDAKKILIQYNAHLHDSMFFAEGPVAKHFLIISEMLNMGFSNELGVPAADRQMINDSYNGIKYEVACHRALAFPSIVEKDGKSIPYEVSASNVADDLAGVDLVVDFPDEKRPTGHFLYGIDVKKRGSFMSKMRDIGKGAVSSVADRHFIEIGTKDVNGREMYKDIINAEGFGQLGDGFDFSQTDKDAFRKSVFSRVDKQLEQAQAA